MDGKPRAIRITKTTCSEASEVRLGRPCRLWVKGLNRSRGRRCGARLAQYPKVRCSLESEHRADMPPVPGCATSGLMQCGKRGVAAASLDHLVGASDKRRRKFEAERLGRPEINDQLKLRGLLDRQVGGPCALEDLIDEPGGAVIKIRIVHAIAQEPAQLYELAGR